MRIAKKILFFIVVFIANAMNTYAAPAPIDPGTGAGAPPPPRGLSINDYEWVLWIVGVLFFLYTFYIKNNNFQKIK